MNEQQIRLMLTLAPQVISLASQGLKLARVKGYIPQVLDTLAVIMGEGEKAFDDLVQLRKSIELMVTEMREPNEEEWALLKSRSDIAHEIIQNATVRTASDILQHVPLPEDEGTIVSPFEPRGDI